MLDAFGAAGGRGQEDGGHSGLGRGHPPGSGLLRRQVRDDEAVHPQGGGLLGGALQAVLQNGVVITHQDQRNIRFPAYFPRQFQNLLEMHPALHRPVAGRLDGGAVRQGVGEGNAQLQQVGASGPPSPGPGPWWWPGPGRRR